ncbi:MAG: Na+/H+ antiporter NhaA [Myxococcales bacterium]|nr:MAG: Na+/H+ antiporter NhaA [Myxococcales bacterium]
MSNPSHPVRGPLDAPPPEAWGPLLRFARIAGRPLERFLHIEAASGVLLLVTAALALAWANSPWAESYQHLWHTPLGVRVGAFVFERPLEWVVNDGLMAIFFFLVGLEIRREVHCGELSEWRRAALPAAAALGGMLAPAGIYAALATSPDIRGGWGIPMATDIAFAVGILTLLGKRVPPALRVLLLALAVIDDLGAIIVIAVFYSAGLDVSGFAVAAAGLAGIVLMQRLGVRSKLAYVAPAVVAWAGVYSAGVHPTIAGVVVGLMTPVRAWLGAEGFVSDIRREVQHLEATEPKSLSAHQLAGALKHVNAAQREALSPAESLIHSLHPWVAFGIMPLFALANSGVSLEGAAFDDASWRVAGSVALGLVVGKPLGVLLAIFVAVRLGLSRLPTGVTPLHLVVLGVVAGVGFTMALFIAQLAFADQRLLAAAKIGILIASGAAGLAAFALGSALLPKTSSPKAARTADDAERSSEL